MNKSEYLVLGLAAVAVFLIYKSQTPKVNGPRDTGKPYNTPATLVPPIDNWKWTGNSYGGSSDTGGAFGLGGF